MDEKERTDQLNKLVMFGTAFIISRMILKQVQNLVIHRDRRKKMKALQEWEAECYACIEISKERIMALAKDPNISEEEFEAEMKKEEDFLNIITNQPPPKF